MGGENLIKNKVLLSFLVLSIFLTSIIGNTVVSEERDISIFYFDHHNDRIEWETDPLDMVDGDPDDYASTTDGSDNERCDGNTCMGTESGTITLVEIRTRAHWNTNDRDIILTPWFSPTLEGDEHIFNASNSEGWSDWFDITDDANSHTWWNWTHVKDLECEVTVGGGSPGSFTLYCSIVEIRVTYT